MSDVEALRALLRARREACGSLSAAEGLAAGVDIGGTRHTVALAGLGGDLRGLERRELRPGGTAADILASVLELIESLRRARGGERKQVVRVGVGFGGPVDHERGAILRSHHVPGWNGFPLRQVLEARLGVPVMVDNDANAAALGEAVFGAGRPFRHLLYVNVGTGIGGGIVVDRRVYHGEHGLAGEIGHMKVMPGGPLCPCGGRGCLEAVASGPSIGRRAQEAAVARPERAAALRALSDGDASQLNSRHVFRAAGAGDPLAIALVRETAGFLATALASAVSLLDPGAVVIGGGVAETGELLFAPLREAFSELVLSTIPPTPLLPAELGYDAGVVGALALALGGN